MPDNAWIRPVEKKENRVDEQHNPIAQWHVEIIERPCGKLENNKIGYDACNKYNEDVDRKDDPPRQIAKVLEPLPKDEAP